MKNAIILHGYPSKSEYYSENAVAPGHNHWFAWLQMKLLQDNIYAETPTMPDAYSPAYEKWRKAIERCDHIGEDTILIGHSCGGGFWVKYLCQHPELRVGKVVLVAPWLDPDDELKNDFHKNYMIDGNLVARTKGITVFSSSNDHSSILESVKRLKNAIADIKVVEFKNYGHFCIEDMKTNEFPELLKEVIT